MDWYSKKQSTMETSTHGSEFVSAHTCVELYLRNTILYLGVPIRQKSYMFGDKNLLLAVPSKCTPRYFSAKLHYPFIGSGRTLYLR